METVENHAVEKISAGEQLRADFYKAKSPCEIFMMTLHCSLVVFLKDPRVYTVHFAQLFALH